MRICKLTLITTVDGKENRVQRMGKIARENDVIKLYYREENAQVSLFLEKNIVWIDREGDYALRLCLQQGERSEGTLCVGGSEGKIPTQTYFVGYVSGENELEITLHYALLFERDAQDMRLKIIVKTKG